MKSKRGIILVTILIILFVLSVLTIGLLSLVITNKSISDSIFNSTKALYIAEAGVASASRYKEDFSDSGKFDDGEYEFTIELEADGLRHITSTGKIKGFQKTVALIIDDNFNIIYYQEGY